MQVAKARAMEVLAWVVAEKVALELAWELVAKVELAADREVSAPAEHIDLHSL